MRPTQRLIGWVGSLTGMSSASKSLRQRLQQLQQVVLLVVEAPLPHDMLVVPVAAAINSRPTDQGPPILLAISTLKTKLPSQLSILKLGFPVVVEARCLGVGGVVLVLGEDEVRPLEVEVVLVVVRRGPADILPLQGVVQVGHNLVAAVADADGGIGIR